MLIAAVLFAVLVGTLAQSISGIGFALVCGPLLVAALGPQDGVRLSVLLSLVLDVLESVEYDDLHLGGNGHRGGAFC